MTSILMTACDDFYFYFFEISNCIHVYRFRDDYSQLKFEMLMFYYVGDCVRNVNSGIEGQPFGN